MRTIRGSALRGVLGFASIALIGGAEAVMAQRTPNTAPLLSECSLIWEVTGGERHVISIEAKNVRPCEMGLDASEIGPGGFLNIEEQRGDQRRAVRIEPTEGPQMKFRFTVDGQARPFDAEARAWLSGILARYNRQLPKGSRTGFPPAADGAREEGAPRVLIVSRTR